MSENLGPYETVVLSPLDRRLLRDVNTTLTMIYERLCDMDELLRNEIKKRDLHLEYVPSVVEEVDDGRD